MKLHYIKRSEYVDAYRHVFCEAPRHRDSFIRAVFVMILGPMGDQASEWATEIDGELYEIQGMCDECMEMVKATDD